MSSNKKEKIKKKTYKDYDITLKEFEFCRIYATSEEFFAHGTKSYQIAFRQKNPVTAGTGASLLLRNQKILDCINDLLELDKLNDPFVDKQLALVISQSADLKSKVAAIKEYNTLRSRITKHLDVTTGGKPLIDAKKQVEKIYEDGEGIGEDDSSS